MVKAIIVKKKELKISAKEYEKWLKETSEFGAVLLKKRDQQVEETLKKLKEKKLEEA